MIALIFVTLSSAGNLLMNILLQGLNGHFIDQDLQLVLLLLNLLPQCDQLNWLGTLFLSKEQFFFSLFSFQFIDGFLKAFIVFDWQKVVTFVEDTGWSINLLGRRATILNEVAKNGLPIRVLKMNNIIVIKLVRMNAIQLQLKALFPSILPGSLFFRL